MHGASILTGPLLLVEATGKGHAPTPLCTSRSSTMNLPLGGLLEETEYLRFGSILHTGIRLDRNSFSRLMHHAPSLPTHRYSLYLRLRQLQRSSPREMSALAAYRIVSSRPEQRASLRRLYRVFAGVR